MTSPPWLQARRFLNRARTTEREISDRRPDFIHELDEVRAAMRDAVDELGLSLSDEWTVYTGLVFATMTTDLAEWLKRLGILEDEAVEGLGTVVGALALALWPYTPPEAQS